MCSRRNKVTITGVSGTGMEIASGWVSECWLTRQTPLCVSNLSKSLKRRGLLSFRSDGRDRLVTCCVPRNQFFSLLNRKKWTICWYSFVSLGFCLAIEKDRCNIRVKEIQSRRPFKGIVFFFQMKHKKIKHSCLQGRIKSYKKASVHSWHALTQQPDRAFSYQYGLMKGVRGRVVGRVGHNSPVLSSKTLDFPWCLAAIRTPALTPEGA